MIRLLVILIFILCSESAFAASCSAVYPSVLQGHSNSGTLTINSNASVINAPSTVLPFVNGTINDNQGDSCVTAECSVSGAGSVPLTLPTYPVFSGGSSFTTGTTTLGEGGFNTDTFGAVTARNGVVNFSNNFDEYFIETLTVDRRATVILKPGTYWVGRIDINSGGNVNLAIETEGNGTAYVYVLNGVTINQNRSVDGFGANSVLSLTSYANITVNSNASVSGLMYAAQTFTINSNSVATGSISASNVTLNSNSTVEYVSNLFDTYDFSEVCEEDTQVVDHYRITHPGSALTCESASVNVKACLDATCSAVYDQSSQVTLSPFGEVFSIPANAINGANAEIQQTSVGSQILALTNEAPAALNNPVCIGGPVGNTCQISFVNASFDFYGADINTDIDDQLAETLFAGVNIRAVQDTDGVCVPALANESIDITFTHSCTSPASCKTPLEYNGVDLDNEALVSIAFDGDGTANLPQFIYRDAGQIDLSARATLDSGATIESGSESILVYPDGLDISGTQVTTNYDAGADFTLEIKAVGALGGVLPNYVPGDLNFRLTSNIGPQPGELTYASGQTTTSSAVVEFDEDIIIASSEFSDNDGVYQFQANYSEVDQLTFSVRDNNYSGRVITNINPASTLGLFLPAYFDVDTFGTAAFANACEANSPTPVFTYFGEPMGFATPAGAGEDPQFDLTARNADGVITENYRDGYWSWLPNASELNNITFSDVGNPTGVTLVPDSASAIAEDINNGGVENGRKRLTVSNLEVIYNKADSPIEPITTNAAMTLPANLFSDNNYPSNPICYVSNYDKANPGACEDFVISNIAGAELRWGRILMENTFGPENEDLLVAVKTEYFSGNTFIRNRDDQCTSFNWVADNFNKQDRSVEVGYTDITSEVDVSGSFTMLDGITQGIDGITVTAPANGARGELLIELLPVPGEGSWDSYLQFDWDADEAGVQNPSATVTFGQFRGNERIIHWREVF